MSMKTNITILTEVYKEIARVRIDKEAQRDQHANLEAFQMAAHADAVAVGLLYAERIVKDFIKENN